VYIDVWEQLSFNVQFEHYLCDQFELFNLTFPHIKGGCILDSETVM